MSALKWTVKNEEAIRADERRKVLHEQRALDVNLQISAEELRAEERTKTIKEFYDKSADALMWLRNRYGDDLYIKVGNTLWSVKEQLEEQK